MFCVFVDLAKDYAIDVLYYVMLCYVLCCRIIAFDNERISVLEKRQAHLMDDNEKTRNEIMNTLRQNEQIVEVMDSLLDRSKTNAQFLQTEDDLDELCFVMKSKCAIMGTLAMWSTL